MATERKTSVAMRRRSVAICAMGLAACSLLFSAGCPGHKSQLTGDPLFGEHGLKPTGPNPQPPPPPPGKAQASVPAVPNNTFSPTNAQLAGVQPLSGARPLAIDAGGQRNLQPTTGTAIPTSGGPGIFKPVVQAVPREALQSPNVVPVGGANVWAPQPPANSPAGLAAQLSALGIQFHKTDILPEGGVRFTARVPNRADPSTSRIFEAVGPDQPSAIQAVLRQIEAQR